MRNFIYNKSDILVALAIILAALVIIFFRVSALMDFGSTGTANASTPSSTVTSEEENNSEGTAEGEPTTSEEDNNPEGTTETSFLVEPGSTIDSIAEDLVRAGCISTTKEFTDEVKAQGAEAKLKTGKFTIPKDSNVSEILKILLS